jgi:hypothetical protein
MGQFANARVNGEVVQKWTWLGRRAISTGRVTEAPAFQSSIPFQFIRLAFLEWRYTAGTYCGFSCVAHKPQVRFFGNHRLVRSRQMLNHGVNGSSALIKAR